MKNETDLLTRIISHDLREPLRSIVTYSQLLQQKLKGSLDEETELYLKYIGGSARRVHKLIEDITEYASAGSLVGTPCEVDLNEVLALVKQDIEPMVKEKKAKVSSDTLPTIMCLRIPFSVILQNLISNSLLHSHPDRIPEVKVYAENKNNEWVFTVEDNGRGFDGPITDDYFVPFGRTTKRSEARGFGLPIVKKMVDMHRGRVWGESKKEIGSRFYFSIPTDYKVSK